jgi:hypothetical protein
LAVTPPSQRTGPLAPATSPLPGSRGVVASNRLTRSSSFQSPGHSRVPPPGSLPRAYSLTNRGPRGPPPAITSRGPRGPPSAPLFSTPPATSADDTRFAVLEASAAETRLQLALILSLLPAASASPSSPPPAQPAPPQNSRFDCFYCNSCTRRNCPFRHPDGRSPQ